MNKDQLEQLFEQLDNSAKNWTLDRVAVIDRKLLFWLLLFMLCLIFPVVINGFQPNTETAGAWFQRSGSVVVALSLLAEIQINVVEKLAISQGQKFLICNKYLKSKYQKAITVRKYLTFTLVAFGTVIWGYGDILLSMFSS